MNLSSRRLPLYTLVFATIISVANALPSVAALVMPPLLYFSNSPFPVETPRVQPGQPVVVISRPCYNAFLLTGSVQTTITRELVPYAPELPTLRLPPVRSVSPGDAPRGPDGCREARNATGLVVPIGTWPGMYYWIGEVRWSTSLRTGSAPWRTQAFEVIP